MSEGGRGTPSARRPCLRGACSARTADGYGVHGAAQRTHCRGAPVMRAVTRISGPTAGEWKRTATIQTMHDGRVLPTWGVLVSDPRRGRARKGMPMEKIQKY